MKKILTTAWICIVLLTGFLPGINAQTDSLLVLHIPAKNTETKNSFCVLGNTLVNIPLRGGIYDLVLQTWLISPKANLQILDYDICTTDTSLLLAMKKDSLIILAKGKQGAGQYLSKTYATVPGGFCQLASIGQDSFFVWHYNREVSSIYLYSNEGGLKPLLITHDIITAFYPLNSTAFLFATGTSLYSLSARENPVALKKFPADIDGITQNHSGQLLISTFNGIYAIHENKKICLLTNEFHGIMKYGKDKLFVLDRSRNKIIQLAF